MIKAPAIFWYEHDTETIIDTGVELAVRGYLLAGTSEISGRDQKTADLKRFATELGTSIVNVFSSTRNGTQYHYACFMYKGNDGIPEHEREQAKSEMRANMRETMNHNMWDLNSR